MGLINNHFKSYQQYFIVCIWSCAFRIQGNRQYTGLASFQQIRHGLRVVLQGGHRSEEVVSVKPEKTKKERKKGLVPRRIEWIACIRYDKAKKYTVKQ